MLCAKFGWNSLCGSKLAHGCFVLSLVEIRSLVLQWSMDALCLVWLKLSLWFYSDPWMLCAMSDWSWLCGSGVAQGGFVSSLVEIGSVFSVESLQSWRKRRYGRRQQQTIEWYRPENTRAVGSGQLDRQVYDTLVNKMYRLKIHVLEKHLSAVLPCKTL